MKRFLCLLLSLALLVSLPLPALAHNAKGHNDELYQVLFGEQSLSERISESLFDKDHEYFTDDAEESAFKALEYASYLTLDQYNHYGQEQLDFLRNDRRIEGLPESIDAIDFTGNQYHRMYTHRGWEYSYIIDKGNWKTRKEILLRTVQHTFGFREPINTEPLTDGYEQKCNSMAALIYYVHVLGDHEATQGKVGKNGNFTYPQNMMAFARAHASESNPDIFWEIKKHAEVLFRAQNSSKDYKNFMAKLDDLAEKARKLEATTGGINTEKKFDKRHEQIKDLFDLLYENIPRLLAQEKFFTDVFPVASAQD